MADLPYPFSRDNGRYYLVALGNGEYIRVTLANDYTHEYRRAQAWMTVARQLIQQANPTARLEDIIAEADHLFIDAFHGN